MGQDHPDSKLFPHATGAAEKMVQEHQKEEALKLYSGWVLFKSMLSPLLQLSLLVLSIRAKSSASSSREGDSIPIY